MTFLGIFWLNYSSKSLICESGSELFGQRFMNFPMSRGITFGLNQKFRYAKRKKTRPGANELCVSGACGGGVKNRLRQVEALKLVAVFLR